MAIPLSKEITIAIPRQDTVTLLRQANAILDLKRKFKKDVHYGPPYPGSTKDTLLKPGAELLCRRFGIRPRYEVVDKVLQINPANLAESVIIYVYRCEMVDIASGVIVGEAIGACSSLEDKYRQRKAERLCPECGKNAIIKGKDEYGGGWLCYKKKGGCGEKFKDGDKAIEEQPEGVTINPNPVNELNTIIKMAQKRALTSAVLVATGASAYFTPGDEAVKDLYDVPLEDDSSMVEGEFEEIDAPETFPADEPKAAPPAEDKPTPPPNVDKDTGEITDTSAVEDTAFTHFRKKNPDTDRADFNLAMDWLKLNDEFVGKTAEYLANRAASIIEVGAHKNDPPAAG